MSRAPLPAAHLPSAAAPADLAPQQQPSPRSAAPPSPPPSHQAARRRARLWRGTAKALLAGLVLYGLLWLTGVLGTLGATYVARQSRPAGVRMDGINHFVAVDGRVWRGSAPRASGYRALAARGVTTVVDLRAEDLGRRELAEPGRAGLRLVRLPVRDGQTPTERQVDRFLSVVRGAEGHVYVHCGAGVGRSGSMSAAYLVRTGQETPVGAVRRNLAVGPPSLEQIYYALNQRRDESAQPPLAVRAVSRALDAPRRIWSSL